MNRFARVLPLAVLLAGCGGDPAGPSADLHVRLEGAIERARSADLVVTRNGRVLSLDSARVTIQPAQSAAFVTPGRIRWMEAGAVRIIVAVDGFEASIDTTVAAPPDIYFDLRVDGNRDIYRVALDGRDLRRITTAPEDDLRPTAGGTRLVFQRIAPDGGDLVERPIGEAEERLVSSTTGATESSPALTLDGTGLAFTRTEGAGPRLMVSPGPDGAEVQTVSGLPGSRVDGDPAWAPAGDRLAFMTTAGSADLWLFAPAEGEAQPLVTTEHAEVEPAWSPDGSVVAYAAQRGSENGIYLQAVDGGDEVRVPLPEPSVGQPAFLPDGRLLYTAFDGAGASRLRWFDPAGPDSSRTIPTQGGMPQNATFAPPPPQHP